MIINDAVITKVEKDIVLDITFKGKDFKLDFTTIDGKVIGDCDNGVYTAYLTYLNENSTKVRQKHFEFFKEFIENRFK